MPLLLSWHWRIDVLAVIGGLGAAYLTGWVRLRRRNPAAIGPGPLSLYLTGLLAIVLALLSPIDAVSARLLAMHMVQHELLTMVAPPLLLLGDPLRAIVWALPPPFRRRAGVLLMRGGLLRRGLAALTFMPVAWVLYMVVLWGWHLPAAYQASLGSELLHDVQHLSFFGAALLFWWPLVNAGPRPHGRVPYAYRLVYVLASVALTMPPIMAIAFFVPRVIYPYYAAVPRLWGVSALDDQAIGWGLMGVIDGGVYAIAVLALVAGMAWDEERMTRLERAAGAGESRG